MDRAAALRRALMVARFNQMPFLKTPQVQKRLVPRGGRGPSAAEPADGKSRETPRHSIKYITHSASETGLVLQLPETSVRQKLPLRGKILLSIRHPVLKCPSPFYEYMRKS